MTAATSTTLTNGLSSCDSACGLRGSRNQNLAANNPASQYQRQKIIQNTVRVYASLYTMNLAGLAGYQPPSSSAQVVEQAGAFYTVPAKTYWNQMSDRARPSHQVTKVASGGTYHTSSTRHTITRDRPGAMSPGGVGCDIKHNSYDRYLNKLKGRAPLRRGPVPPTFGAPIPFDRAFPVYGGKTVKTAIVSGCDCANADADDGSDERIYASVDNALSDRIAAVHYTFHVGDFVWAKKADTDKLFYKAAITNIVDGGLYTVAFTDDGTIRSLNLCELFIYFDCDCVSELPIREQAIGNITTEAEYNHIFCQLLASSV